jgi:hypothetical protein
MDLINYKRIGTRAKTAGEEYGGRKWWRIPEESGGRIWWISGRDQKMRR